MTPQRLGRPIADAPSDLGELATARRRNVRIDDTERPTLACPDRSGADDEEGGSQHKEFDQPRALPRQILRLESDDADIRPPETDQSSWRPPGGPLPPIPGCAPKWKVARSVCFMQKPSTGR